MANIDPCLLPAGTRIKTTLYYSEVIPSGDFETYSEAGYIIDQYGKVKGAKADGKGGLPVVGTPVYAEHPTAEVLSFKYDLKDGKGRRWWAPGFPNPEDLHEHIINGGLFEAWNIGFEFYIWNVVCVPKYGWPPLPLTQCRCAMAKARRYSLPGSLDIAAKVLGTPEKDPDGKRLINKLTRPVSSTKKRKAHRWTQATAWDDFLKLYAYNDDDVVAEDHASALIPDLDDYELPIWQLDQVINARGVQVDTKTLDAALDILGQAERKYTLELVTITSGAVGSVSEVQKLGDWLTTQGCGLPNLQKETVSDALAGNLLPLTPAARRALEIRDVLGSANVKKLRTLKLQVSSDGRLRNQYVYCGADRTGRWSCGGVQLQNITATGPNVAYCEACEHYFGQNIGADICPRCKSFMWHNKEKGEWPIDAVIDAVIDIRTRNLEHVENVWGDPITVLCGCLRGMFIAAPGKVLLCCDFSAIEAVAQACLARCQWRIDVFSTPGECIYTQSASKITGTPLEEYKAYKKQNGTHHPDRKKIGKIAELASGYGGWIGAWVNFGADEYFTDDEIKGHILKWRAESPEIVYMWGGQYVWCGPGKWDYRHEFHGLEGCAIQAILNPGQCFAYNDISYGVADDILFCRLPSGRMLHYHKPRLHDVPDKLNRGPCLQITFEGYNSNSQKGPVGWQRMETYGGRLFENVVQAVSRDIQAEAMLRLEANGYPVVMHTHDEGCAEIPSDDWRTVEDMVAIMTQRPTWAQWWPINAAGWKHERYQKD